MANPAHLEMLKQGVKAWNRWLEENSAEDLIIDLSGCDLRGLNFIGANLIGADITQTNLWGADLRNCNLYRADLSFSTLISVNLSNANLSGAVIVKANMWEANLSYCDLSGADLQSTDLGRALFEGAKLKGANLALANLFEANFGGGVDLSDANLSSADLTLANLNKANLRKANLVRANLSSCQLNQAFLNGANLFGANLHSANLSESDLSETELSETNFNRANLSKAILYDSKLFNANLIDANVNEAIISKSRVHAVNVWDLRGDFKEQKDLIISRHGDPVVTVDNIKIAQFIYLVLNNQEIQNAINTLTSKSVLILGRFAIPERKKTLDAIKNKLREHDLLPIVFDFERPVDRDFTETIKTLAGLSYFVIADVTNPKSSPLELQATVPDYQIPFVPIIQEGEQPFAMMIDLQKKYNWVLNTVTYDSADTLMKILKPLIIDPAMKKRNELRIIKAQVPEVISGKDFLEKEKE
jgi:uncharacterized protein YjbI with pentapeptide repeats